MDVKNTKPERLGGEFVRDVDFVSLSAVEEKKHKKLVRFFVNSIVENKKNKNISVDFVGYNWRDDNDLPIAILFGFNPWKRAVVSAYLKGYKTAFVLGRASFLRVYIDLISKLPSKQEVVFVGWGNKLPLDARVYAKNQYLFGDKISTFSIEDGFLRSIGSGLLHTRPASLCIDESGIYFDARSPSAIENLIANYDFDSDQNIINRAKGCIGLLRAARLTKYYNPKPYSSEMQFYRTGRYSILVVGQVEDDASITAGKTRISNNADLILAAKKEHPGADIYYRPHPDYWAGNRKPKSNLKNIEDICAVVPPKTSLYDLFDVVDHVYTMTSLAGFEALLYGLKVTTFGAPFYSNWGLTDDRVRISRRKRKVTLEELFAATHLLYPKYLHLESDELSSFEEISSYFVIESLKNENIFELDGNELFRKSLPFKDMLSVPFKVLCYLHDTGSFSEANRDVFLSIVKEKFLLADYPQISFLLSKTSNYDELVDYSNICVDYLAENIADCIHNTVLIENFLYSLSLSLKNSNGRVIKELPNMNSWIFKLSTEDVNFYKLILSYVRCLSYNLQYDIIGEFIRHMSHANYCNLNKKFKAHLTLADMIAGRFVLKPDIMHFRSIAQVLQQKPSRSERNSAKRHSLAVKAAYIYANMLDVKYPSPLDALMNRALYWCLLDDAIQSASDFKLILQYFGKKGAEDSFDQLRLSINKRESDLIFLGNCFLRGGDFKLVENVLALVANREALSALLLELNLYKKTRDFRSFLNLLNGLSDSIKENDKIVSIYARFLREVGLFEKSKSAYGDLSVKAKTVSKKVSVDADIKKIEFCQKTSEILNSVPQPSFPKGVVFLASQTCFNTLAMMTPSLVELKKRGYAVVNLTEGMTEHQPVGLDFIDQFQGAIPLDLAHPRLKYDWIIDWEGKKVEADGIEFYQGFYESLSVYARRYYVDLNTPLINRAFRKMLLRSDTCLALCEKIFRQVVMAGMPVAFVSGNSHVTPFSVFRDYARFKDHPLLSFINCNVAYEAYFSNLGSKFANTMCVTDMTLHKNIRAPFMARRDQFERWYDENKTNPEYIEKAEALIKVNRVGSTSNVKEQEVIEYLKDQKAAGKKIVCAFGKVPVDLNVPYDGGVAHGDMADWISHTVEVCNGADNIVLLVKPHPHELRPEIALDLVESFHDLIAVEPKGNVKLLGHKDINGHALAPYLDLAILYNGSSGVELAAQGIPVLMASYFGRHDYPVDLIYPKSRGDYASFILSADYPAPSEDTRHRAAFLLCYLGTEEISILNQYSLRQLTNDKIGVPQWREDKIRNFLQSGDPKMELIASRIVEKIELNRKVD